MPTPPEGMEQKCLEQGCVFPQMKVRALRGMEQTFLEQGCTTGKRLGKGLQTGVWVINALSYKLFQVTTIAPARSRQLLLREPALYEHTLTLEQLVRQD